MPTDAPEYTETVKLYSLTQEGKWTGTVTRKKTVPITFIREGATDNTWVDYWMDGQYSTLIISNGEGKEGTELEWELQMTLHVPDMKDEYRYMIWFQFFDEYLTNLKDD